MINKYHQSNRFKSYLNFIKLLLHNAAGGKIVARSGPSNGKAKSNTMRLTCNINFSPLDIFLGKYLLQVILKSCYAPCKLQN